jgi:hypothetical protein
VKHTTPLLQLTANGSPHAVPPSWQQASAVRVEPAIKQTTVASRSRFAAQDALTRLLGPTTKLRSRCKTVQAARPNLTQKA